MADEQDAAPRADAATARTLPAADLAPRADEATARTLDAPPPAPQSSAPAAVHAGAAAVDDAGFAARYQQRSVLGRGGMGEVRLLRDLRIGRDVAMKVIRADRGAETDARVRFLREARVQGQLEHPAVVPVYDLGVSPDGEIYFTMKRVRGVSLREVLDRLRAGDAETASAYSQHRLLTVFSSICLAVDFAHRRGVLHRDLKPANLMLGDFGEVHVLDWGLARLAGDAEAAGDAAGEAAGEAEGVDVPLLDGAHTVAGRVMGTPGYMAPEQACGDLAGLSPRSDVYALGAILFELLTRMPLHEGRSSAALINSTLLGADARPSARHPAAEVPPELEALCVRATALRSEDRPASARALHEEVERFLAGDRDLALRRELARAHAERAAALAEQAVGEGATEAARSEALQAAGRALALDPRNEDAARACLRLLTRPPREVPAEARAALERSAEQASRRAHRGAGLSGLSLLPILPLALWMGVRSWPMAAALLVAVLLLGLLGLVNARAGRRWAAYLVPAVVLVATLGASRIAGVFLLVPALATVGAASFAQQASRGLRLLGIGACVAGILLAEAGEALGILPPSYEFAQGNMIVRPQMLFLPATPTRLFLLVCTVAAVLICASYISYLRRALGRAEERFHVQHWQLRQLLPREARGPASTESPRPL